jgi:hypothetical protein
VGFSKPFLSKEARIEAESQREEKSVIEKLNILKV